MQNVYFHHILGKAYPALNVFELGENLKVEAVCLASVSAPTIHVVSKGKDKPQYISYTLSLQETLSQVNTLLLIFMPTSSVPMTPVDSLNLNLKPYSS